MKDGFVNDGPKLEDVGAQWGMEPIMQTKFEQNLAHTLQDHFKCGMGEAHRAVYRLRQEGYFNG